MAGMKSITDMRDRVTRLRDELEDGSLMRYIIGHYEDEICKMNADEQLYNRGVNAYNVPIMDYRPYTPTTAFIKDQKRQPTDRVTLRDTGAFHRSFYVEADDKGFSIMATDEKTPSLIRKYGREILGLTPENKTELTWRWVFPELLQTAKEMIYGN